MLTIKEGEGFEGHQDNSITLFLDSDNFRAEQSPEHTGCQVIIEAPIMSEDKREYNSASKEEAEVEPEKTKALGKPYRKIVRQWKGGPNRLKMVSDEKTAGRIMLTQYMRYEATDTVNITPAYWLPMTAKTSPRLPQRSWPQQTSCWTRGPASASSH